MQRGPGSHRPWAADWQCGCHVSSPCCPPEHSDLLLPVLQFMEAQMCWPSGGSTQQMQQASALPPIAHPGSGPCPEWWILD